MKKYLQPLLIVIFIHFACSLNLYSQSLLQKKISIDVTRLPVSDVLTLIEKRGGFFFSYNSSLINTDSLVSVYAESKSISDLLYSLFGARFQYTQQDNHIIITKVISKNKTEITGRVIDKNSREPVPYATVYERSQLVATMTNEQGLFTLNLKTRNNTDSISVSRISYSDTIVAFPAGTSNDITITINATDKSLDSVFVNMMKRDWLSRQILSSKELINSINLKHFIAKQPFQVSVFPGIGTHGKMSSQVVNKFSFNVFGGFNGGVNGVEIGGLYNITNNNARYVQVAGLFNMVGGHSEGVQIGGLFNRDSSVNGVQSAGLFNKVNVAKGFQVAGLFNEESFMNGFQAGGLFNKVKIARGVQIAGLFNKDSLMNGFQVAVVNINHKIKGLQIGVVNISDSIQGIPLGLVNLGKGSKQQLTFSYNEMGVGMISYKSGNPKLYNILSAGSGLDYNRKVFSVGYGFGTRMALSKVLEANPELTSNYFYNGNWKKQNISARLQWNFQVKISNVFSIYAGPAITLLYSKAGSVPAGYKTDLSNGAHRFSVVDNVSGWFGWNAGVNFF